MHSIVAQKEIKYLMKQIEAWKNEPYIITRYIWYTWYKWPNNTMVNIYTAPDMVFETLTHYIGTELNSYLLPHTRVHKDGSMI